MKYDPVQEAEIDEHTANDWADSTKIPYYYADRRFIATDPFAFSDSDLHEREKNIVRDKHFISKMQSWADREEALIINSRGKFGSQEALDAAYDSIEEAECRVANYESLTNEQWDAIYPKPKSKTK